MLPRVIILLIEKNNFADQIHISHNESKSAKKFVNLINHFLQETLSLNNIN